MIDFSRYGKEDTILIDDNFLAKLNAAIDNVQSEKQIAVFDYDNLQMIAHHVVKYSCFIDFPKSRAKQQFFTREEIVGYALQFFKHLGGRISEEASRIIFQLDSYIKLNIFDPKDPIMFDRSKEFGHMERAPHTSCTAQSGNATISVLLENGTKHDSNRMYSLDNIFNLVHEIAHRLDYNIFRGKVTPHGNILNITNRIYSESCSYAFEFLLLRYLIDHSDIDRDALWYKYAKKNDSSCYFATCLYWKLLLAKEQEKNGRISQDFISSIPCDVKKTLLATVSDSESLLFHAKYVLGKLVAPTIVKNYNERGVKALEQYLEIVKTGSFDNALAALGINVEDTEDETEQLKNETIQLTINMISFQADMLDAMRQTQAER